VRKTLLRTTCAGIAFGLATFPSIAQGTKRTSQQPKTAPATQNILFSYEGQNVTSVEIAGRPDLDTSVFLPLLKQQAGQPFSRDKTEASVEALKAAGKFSEVQLQVEPEANGVRLLLVVEPAVWFGLFEFPGAERFSYSRLVQVANYPPQAPFNAGSRVIFRQK
jgi:outer membrane protein assembly factor BamA